MKNFSRYFGIDLFFIPNTANGGPKVVKYEVVLDDVADEGGYGYGPSFDSFCNVKIVRGIFKFQRNILKASYLCLIPNEIYFRFAWCC